MTDKRFEVFKIDMVIGINDNGKSIGNVYAICDLLNELNDECEFLEIDNEALEDGATKYAELCHKLLKENEQLKQEIKMLKTTISRNEAYIKQLIHRSEWKR